MPNRQQQLFVLLISIAIVSYVIFGTPIESWLLFAAVLLFFHLFYRLVRAVEEIADKR